MPHFVNVFSQFLTLEVVVGWDEGKDELVDAALTVAPFWLVLRSVQGERQSSDNLLVLQSSDELRNGRDAGGMMTADADPVLNTSGAAKPPVQFGWLGAMSFGPYVHVAHVHRNAAVKDLVQEKDPTRHPLQLFVSVVESIRSAAVAFTKPSFVA